jgi:predicted kinase
MKNTKKKLIILIGLPYSGKSTWAKEQTYPIVNRDSIRLALHGQRYIREAESFVSAIEEVMVKSLFLAGHDTVIVDACHTTEKRRLRWKSEEWNIEPIIFNIGEKICLERAEAKKDWEMIPVIKRMASATDVNAIKKASTKYDIPRP